MAGERQMDLTPAGGNGVMYRQRLEQDRAAAPTNTFRSRQPEHRQMALEEVSSEMQAERVRQLEQIEAQRLETEKKVADGLAFIALSQEANLSSFL